MSSQQRRHRRRPRLLARPAVLFAALATALVSAIVGVSLLGSQASASNAAAPATASPVMHGKGGHSHRHPAAAPASATPGSAGDAAPQPTDTPPVAVLPSAEAPTPTPSAAPTADPGTAAPADPSADGTASADGDGTGDAEDRSAYALQYNTTSTAVSGAEANRVGALFSGGVSTGNHFCTASVVHSAGHNLLVTAAHCLDSPGGVVFAPGYRNGTAPYGTWQVTQIYTTNGWSQNGDPDQDFAFLRVAPSNGKQVEDVVGANTLGLNESFSATVRLYGYPDTRDVPLLCANATTQQSSYQRRIDCPSYTGGTSGGPWINASNGHVIGIIGGYQQGGNSADTSYSAYFDQTIGGLYKTATAAS
ncbi:hypothetical protein GCM10009665_48980 [Kitasatospora nipponensis]|uniref:V8-like Glu-specific endopeptidase n=1 Tax=Kitasatospora nipponensis TaxID=258049 RepID=A0ABP4H7V3_9ACTN